ncbi:uncharacterized protein EDB91DRAFT_1123932 [Suillus paluster]|uniref:uncharacterized protein n=1 Tax=Suillus paluster TaxID=48578 RepID=UPI001B85CFA1|nr:uncharacterized protein EDB91DRAFT_1123932 [Suillus paluster]KAG1744698.1 hypothetical protein EDB91DRAFT_1123932 [Suillus paluster]
MQSSHSSYQTNKSNIIMAQFVATCTGVLSNVGSNRVLTLNQGVLCMATQGDPGAQTWVTTYDPTAANASVRGSLKTGTNHLGWTNNTVLAMVGIDGTYNWNCGTQVTMVAAAGVNVTATILNVVYYLKVDANNELVFDTVAPAAENTRGKWRWVAAPAA